MQTACSRQRGGKLVQVRASALQGVYVDTPAALFLAWLFAKGASLYACQACKWYNQGNLTGKAIVCTVALLFGGCPKRNTGPRIVYTPTPPPAASSVETSSTEPPQAVVIQAPAPPAPDQTVRTPAPTPAPQTQHRRRVRRGERPRASGASSEPQPANVPPLGPSESTALESALHGQVVQMQQQIEKRIATLSREWLSPTERETLEGARGFLQQSVRALQESDLQRASNLAHKADLLVQAVEQSQ